MIRFIGIGDLVLDYYYQDKLLIGVNGGKTTSNIIFNLAYLKNNTLMFGTCGNDISGTICINSLKQIGVDITNIEIKNTSTNRFHINITTNGQTTKKRCPICNNKCWYDSPLNHNLILDKLKTSDIVIIDNLTNEITSFINKINNKVMLDLGYYQTFNNLNDEQLIKLLNYKFEIINMNERVEKYLIKRFKLSNSLKLYKILKVKLLIITRGKNGADFIYNNLIDRNKLQIKADEIDSNGAGDSFFASIINDYVKNNFNINQNLINLYFHNANLLSAKAVSHIGARSHIQKLYYIEKQEGCFCKNFILK